MFCILRRRLIINVRMNRTGVMNWEKEWGESHGPRREDQHPKNAVGSTETPLNINTAEVWNDIPVNGGTWNEVAKKGQHQLQVLVSSPSSFLAKSQIGLGVGCCCFSLSTDLSNFYWNIKQEEEKVYVGHWLLPPPSWCYWYCTWVLYKNYYYDCCAQPSSCS